MGQGVCHTASVSDHIEPFVRRLQILIKLYFHIVELHFHTVEQCIIIRRSRRDLIDSLDHLNDTVKDTFRQYEA